jgi:hypothetical protein
VTILERPVDHFSNRFHQEGILLPLSLFMVECFIFNGSLFSYGQFFRAYCALRTLQAHPIVNCDDAKFPQGSHNQGATMPHYGKESPCDDRNSNFKKRNRASKTSNF